MPRLSITLTGKAKEIYDTLKPHERSRWVAEAIIEKFEREKGNGYVTKEEVIEIIRQEIKEMMK